MRIVPDLGFEIWCHPRKGNMIRHKKISGKIQSLRNMKEKSIYGHGPRLFNSLPKCIREWTGSFNGFKFMVDNFLSLVPDRPSIKGYNNMNHDLYGNMTNSITHWIRNLELDKWEHIANSDATLSMCEDNYI